MMIVVMAHWCPHCNEEVPSSSQWEQSGKVPEGLDVVGVSTAVDATTRQLPAEHVAQRDDEVDVAGDRRRQGPDGGAAVGTTAIRS